MTSPIPVVLIAEDDLDDLFLTLEAIDELPMPVATHSVADGLELLERLEGNGAYAGAEPLVPSLILLDARMPRLGGFQALARIRESETLRGIPVVMFSTSNDAADVHRSYALGANSYVTKPARFEDRVALLKLIADYWFRVVRLPLPTSPLAGV